MGSPFRIELQPPVIAEPCSCCGNATVRITRFVYRQDSAFAVYYGLYANTAWAEANAGHRPELHLLISMGKWGDGSKPADREAFYARLRPADEGYALKLEDVRASVWKEVEVMGRLLTRDQAVSHPEKQTLFDLADAIYEQDPSVSGYFARLRCGDPTVPLETSFALPDLAFEVPSQDRAGRIKSSKSFVVLDNEHFYLRCIVPCPVEGQERWGVGAWVELSREDWQRAYDVWDDLFEYSELKLSGTLANDLTSLQIPALPGTQVDIGVEYNDEAPIVTASTNSGLQTKLTRPWPKDEFLRFALDRGYL